MKNTINAILKVVCLAVYLVALASLAGWLPPGSFSRAPAIAAVLLVFHAIELVMFLKHVRLYPGPLWISAVLTLLFGVLHWKPLVDQARDKA